MIAELTGDYCICDRCGNQYESHIRQCKCGTTLLTHSYLDEPLVNADVIKEIKKNISTDTKTLFHCPNCEKEESFYMEHPLAAFCKCCGELMVKAQIELKKFRLSKRWSQKLMAEELGISLRTYVALELKQKRASVKTMLKYAKICGTKGNVQTPIKIAH